MNQQQAVAFVARHVAGLLSAGTFDEAVGVSRDDINPHDAGRLELAIEMVANRLYNMGGTGEIPGPRPHPRLAERGAADRTCETCGHPVEVSLAHPGLAPEHVNPEDNDHPVVLL